MARDPDAQMVVFKDTRGRRSTSQKIRDWVHIFKGGAHLGDAASKLTEGFGTAFLMAGLGYMGRPKMRAYTNPVSSSPPGYLWRMGIHGPPGQAAEVEDRVPMFMGRAVMRVDIVHPDSGMAEGIGALAMVLGLPSADITGFIDKAIGLGLYHAALNGYDFELPLSNQPYVPDNETWANLLAPMLGGPIGGAIWALLHTDEPQPTTVARIHFAGLMGGLVWDTAGFGSELQRRVDAGTLPWPLPPPLKLPNGQMGGIGVDDIVLRQYAVRWLYNLAHAGFITVLARRGLGQKSAD